MPFGSPDRKECLTCQTGWVMLDKWNQGIRSCDECFRKRDKTLENVKKTNDMFKANKRFL